MAKASRIGRDVACLLDRLNDLNDGIIYRILSSDKDKNHWRRIIALFIQPIVRLGAPTIWAPSNGRADARAKHSGLLVIEGTPPSVVGAVHWKNPYVCEKENWELSGSNLSLKSVVLTMKGKTATVKGKTSS